MTRSEILDQAKRCVTEDRNKQHGDPEDSFSRIAAYWSTYLNRDITATDVGIMMALFKIARAEFNPEHEDSWVDACGYLACAGGLNNPVLLKQPEPCGHKLEEFDPDGKYRRYRCRLPYGHDGNHEWMLISPVSQLTENEAGEADATGGANGPSSPSGAS